MESQVGPQKFGGIFDRLLATSISKPTTLYDQVSNDSDNGEEYPNFEENFDQSEIKETMEMSGENIEKSEESYQVSNYSDSGEEDPNFQEIDQSEIEGTMEISEKLEESVESEEDSGAHEISNYGKLKMPCPYCKEMYADRSGFIRHEKLCKKFLKYYRIMSDGYQCKLCYKNNFTFNVSKEQKRHRSKMYEHINAKHGVINTNKSPNKEHLNQDAVIEKRVDSESSFESIEHENSKVSDQGGKYMNNMKNSIDSETSFEYMDQEEKSNDFINKNEENLLSESRKCMICSEMINCKGKSTLGQMNFSKHVKSCRLYFRFFKKTQTDLQCRLCPFNNDRSNESEMYSHLRQKHSNTMFSHIREKLSNKVPGQYVKHAIKMRNKSKNEKNCNQDIPIENSINSITTLESMEPESKPYSGNDHPVIK